MEPAKPQLPITKPYATLNLDKSYVAINRSRTQTLAASEMLTAPANERAELFARYSRYLTMLAGTALSSTTAPHPEPFELTRNNYTLKVSATEISIQDGKGRALTHLGTANKPSIRGEIREGVEAFLLCAFENLLVDQKENLGGQPKAKDLDRRVAATYLHLLGPKEEHKFLTPKLIAYDLNGTAEGRRGIDTTTDTFNKMGSLSIITTTVHADGAERSMAKERAAFTGFHGGDEVRPSFGNKLYGAVAAAYGLDDEQMKRQMVIIGDSDTDAPSDISDVVFIHNDANTPAQALLLLLSTLDKRGNGSFLDGLKAMSSAPGVGPISFRVETRSPGRNKVPVISKVNITFAVPELRDALLSTASDPLGKAINELGFWWMQKRTTENFATLALELVKTPAKTIVKKEIERRIKKREDAVTAAKDAARSLLRDARKMSQLEFLRLFESPASAGDKTTLDTLKAAGTAFLSAQTETRAERRRVVTEHCASAKAKVEELLQAARGRDVMLPRYFLESLVPAARRDRERWLAIMDETIAATEDGSALGEPVQTQTLRNFADALAAEPPRFDENEAALPGKVAALLERGAQALANATETWKLIGQAYAG